MWETDLKTLASGFAMVKFFEPMKDSQMKLLAPVFIVD